MSNKKQSSIDWLVERIQSDKIFSLKNVIAQAKQLHKQEIEQAFDDGAKYQGKVCEAIVWMEDYETKTSEQYYKDTYGE